MPFYNHCVSPCSWLHFQLRRDVTFPMWCICNLKYQKWYIFFFFWQYYYTACSKPVLSMMNARAELTACTLNCTPASFKENVGKRSCNPPVSGPPPYHFFSGIGRGTAFTRQGKLGWPERFLPRIVPTRFSGRMTKKQIQQTATCRKQKVDHPSLILIVHNCVLEMVFFFF